MVTKVEHEAIQITLLTLGSILLGACSIFLILLCKKISDQKRARREYNEPLDEEEVRTPAMGAHRTAPLAAQTSLPSYDAILEEDEEKHKDLLPTYSQSLKMENEGDDKGKSQ